MPTLPCSPLIETDGLIYFARLCDKIRMAAATTLPDDYLANLGRGMDNWTCQFLGVDYDTLRAKVLEGLDDAAVLNWARETGTTRPDYEHTWFTAYMMNRGFRDDLSKRLEKRKEEDGFSDRDDIQTFMDYIVADESR